MTIIYKFCLNQGGSSVLVLGVFRYGALLFIGILVIYKQKWVKTDLLALHLAFAGDVFDGVSLRCLFSHEMSWMRSGTSLSQFLKVFLPTPVLCVIMGLIDLWLSGNTTKATYYYFKGIIFGKIKRTGSQYFNISRYFNGVIIL